MKKTGLLLVIIAAAWGCIKLLRPEPAAVLTGTTMGTTYTVRLSDHMDSARQEQWRQQIQRCLDGINARMSTYRADSEVSRFNRSASTDWISVSADTALVVNVAQQVARQTNGAFDITINPLVNLWNFGPDRRPSGIPTDAEIEAARKHVGYRHLEVRLHPPALSKKLPQLTIDLSGIAKGFAVDQVGQMLEKNGFEQYMVEVGGEVRTRGTKSDGNPWRIGVELPVVGKRLVQSVLELQDHCLATSGDYRNAFLWDGHWYSHEIDPATGRPAQHGVAAMSVLSSSAMWADAYATGLMVLPPDEAWRLAEAQELEIMMVVRGPSGFERRVTPGFLETIVEDAN